MNQTFCGRNVVRRTAATLLAALLGCRPASDVVPRAAPLSAIAMGSVATPVASRGAQPPGPQAVPSVETTAKSAESGAVLAPGQDALPAEQLRALEVQLQGRRVFRHLILGNMPRRERDSWLLSDDGRNLTLVCEQADPGAVESGRPDSKRWYVVASASFAATDRALTGGWAPHYLREQLVQVARAAPTTCSGVGEQLDLACGPDSLAVLGPNAYVPAETRNPDNGGIVRWLPASRTRVAGLSCRAVAPLDTDDPFDSYDFAALPGRPMLFFADGAIERLVYQGGHQYADFREASVTPLDARLPPHLLNPVP